MKRLHLNLWFLFSIGIVIALGQLGWKDYYHLTKNGESTEGTIIKYEPRNHGSVYYMYTIDKQFYRGSQSQCLKRNIGEKVEVFYLRTNPAISSIERPLDLLINESIAIFLAALIFPSLIVLSIRLKNKNKLVSGLNKP